MSSSGAVPFGRYRLLEGLGSGSMSEAFKAKSFGVEGFEKTLVIKRVLPAFARHQRFIDAFVRHAQLAVRLSHANVVQLVDLGKVEDTAPPSYYTASEYVAGMPLSRLIAQRTEGGFPVELCLYIAAELSKALDHAHRRRDEKLRPLGIVHGDLSPSNVLVSWEGEVKLADFGVGRALFEVTETAERAILAKLPYTSPEQARGDAVTSSSDLFGLGSLLYELFTGKNPFHADSAEAIRKHVTEAVMPPFEELCPNLAPEIGALIARALAVEPSARFASAAELHEQLLAQLYSCSGRFAASELAEILQQFRARTQPPEPLDRALEHEPEPPPPSRTGFRPPEPTSTAPRAFSVLPDRREVSVLVLRYGGKAPDPIRGRARAVVERYGGRLYADAVDGLGAIFGLEQQDARDAETAARCGLVLIHTLASSSLAPSIGIEVGRLDVSDAVEPDKTQTEQLFATARRLARIAKRRVAIAKHAERNLRDLFTLEPADAANTTAWLVSDVRPPQEAQRPFVGRRTELKVIGERLARASRKSAQVLGIVGEPGLGKTRLLREVEHRLQKSSFEIAIYVASCPPRGHEIPYSAIGVMLRTLCGVREGDPPELLAEVEPRLRALGLRDDEVQAVLTELGAIVEGSRGVARPLPSAVARMLVSLAQDRVQLLAWDDAHEMDAESSALLSSIVEELRPARVFLLLAGRPRTGASFRAIPGYNELLLGDLEPDEVYRLVLLRLGVDQVPESLLEFVRQRAGGHPLFIEELLREASESGALIVQDGTVEARLDGVLSVPRPLRALLGDRVRRLPLFERDLIVALSILGSPVDSAVIAAMLEKPIGAINALAESLEERELVRRDGPVALHLGSPLLAEVVLSGLEPDALLELHRRAATAYQTLLGERVDEEAGRIARHLAEAGEPERAGAAFAKSGKLALAARKLDRAAADLGRALELALLEPRASAEVVDWIGALSQAVRHVKSGARLPELVQRLSAWLEKDTALEPRARVKTTIDLALVLGVLHHYKDARRLLQRAAELSAPWPELKRASLTAEAELAIQLGEFTRASALLERVAAIVPGDAAEQHRVLIATAQARAGAGEHQRAIEALDAAGELGVGDDPVLVCERTKVRAIVLAFSRDFRGSALASAEAADQGRSAGLLYEVAVSLHNEGEALLRDGDLARAYASLQSAAAVAAEIGSQRLSNLSRMLLAYLGAVKGSEHAGRELGERLARAEAKKLTWDTLTGRYLLGKMLAERGDVTAARRELELARKLAQAAGNRLIIDDCDGELVKLPV